MDYVESIYDSACEMADRHRDEAVTIAVAYGPDSEGEYGTLAVAVTLHDTDGRPFTAKDVAEATDATRALTAIRGQMFAHALLLEEKII